LKAQYFYKNGDEIMETGWLTEKIDSGLKNYWNRNFLQNDK